MTALVLQARLDSSRLAQKSLLPLGGRPLVFRIMEALAFVNCDVRILACPDDSAASFAPLAEEAGFELLTGPKDDVLARYCLAIKRFGMDRLIRATGDNPFVFVDAANALQQEALALQADYALFSAIPHGTGVECAAAEALLRAEREAKIPAEREHVCPYLYNHPELFRLHRPLAPRFWQGPKLNCSVDTPEDYERVKKLYGALEALSPPEGSSPAERNRGETIISVYNKLFPPVNPVLPREFAGFRESL